MNTKTHLKLLTCATAVGLLMAGQAYAQERVLKVTNWGEYIGEETIANFEKEYGIKVIYDAYDSAESIDAKLLAGNSGYDVVSHSGGDTARLIKAGIIAPLDLSKLDNVKNMDPAIMEQLASDWDPGNKHFIPYMWGTHGVTYNKELVLETFAGAPIGSMDMIFDPANMKELAKCGVSFLDSPGDIIPMALSHLGLDPNSTNKEDYAKVGEMLAETVTWGPDGLLAMSGAAEANTGVVLDFFLPEGERKAQLWIDGWLIPADASNVEDAHLFLNYMMRPEVGAGDSNFTWYATANLTAKPQVDEAVTSSPAAYPTADQVEKMYTTAVLPPKATMVGEQSTSVSTNSDRPWLDVEAEPLIKIRGVTKKFGEFTAVNNVDLDIYQGELFCLLGGSGCGKTTLLRMLAGFEEPTSGKILLDGNDMSDVPPYERPTNMMFQSYALFPHMSVEKNIAFGLEQDKIPKDEIDDRIDAILKLVELQDYKKRKPQQLSGGQRQRVALARALVKEPKLLLLDEPLGALDKKLREQTQFELANIQEEVGITFVVVTHDQEEAMTLSTRIAVMDKANILEGKVTKDSADHVRVDTDLGEIYIDHGQSTKQDSRVWVAIRPEKIHLSKIKPRKKGENQATGIVDDIGYLGNTSIYKIRLDNGRIIDVTSPNQIRPKNRTHSITWEDKVYLHWDASSAMLLNK
ncbi:Putrescine transport ATP-binding protein PotG [Nymphon striatum]|nr:Putrescine transport ATP-binding protein PotG [Nymphon striatum]